MSDALIVIPARMASTRFPGKPLAEISGVSMLRRTAHVARQVGGVEFVVATDHKDIAQHCRDNDLPVVMTDPALASGSDRALAAADALSFSGNIIVNLQGDAPFTDSAHVRAVIEKLRNGDADIATPYIQLDWDGLDRLRSSKRTTPFSGTTLIANAQGRAIWFSKNIIPAIRKEAALRETAPLSPVCRHIGLYAYRRDVLRRYTQLPPSSYEVLEGLEQLRALENGLTIDAVAVNPPCVAMPGIDTPEDLARAEALIKIHGDSFR